MISKILTASTLALGVLSAFLGWQLYDAKDALATLEKAQAVAITEASIAQRATEKTWRQRYDDARDEADAKIKSVNRRYEQAMSALAVCDVTHGLPKPDSDSGAAVPGTAEAVKQPQTGGSQCSGENRAKLRRLYEQQLEVARDCDITAAHYNELLQLYQSIQKD